MALLQFKRKTETGPLPVNPAVEAFLQDYSIEVMPRTAEKIEDFTTLLPHGTRVYVAHIEGTPIEDMVATAKRLAADGYNVMPHFPARIIQDKNTLVSRVNSHFLETEFYWAGPGIFDVLSIPFVLGNPDSALLEPSTIVISESSAKKYFGDENPIGNFRIEKNAINWYLRKIG